jgi:hypothetical protein
LKGGALAADLLRALRARHQGVRLGKVLGAEDDDFDHRSVSGAVGHGAQQRRGCDGLGDHVQQLLGGVLQVGASRGTVLPAAARADQDVAAVCVEQVDDRLADLAQVRGAAVVGDDSEPRFAQVQQRVDAVLAGPREHGVEHVDVLLMRRAQREAQRREPR